jgi:molybdopterin/thiamine biosynthesis adenylyltransferase
MYNELISRNVGLLTPEEQEIIRNLKVGIAGCGMGSFIAEALTRLGIGKVIIADPDKVEISNLNRQSFYICEVDQNKALTLQQHLRMINPEIDVIAWPEALTAQNASRFVKMCDIVTDAIDPLPQGIVVSKEVAKECLNDNKYFLYPIDIGWGALLLTFDPNKIRFGEIVKDGHPAEMLNNLVSFVQSLIQLPDYILKIWEKFQRKELQHYPQPITASLTAATLVTSVIVKIAKREDPPFLMYFDPYSNIFVSESRE